jgi:23S rRNA (cytidine1920-2'-O)/16S rRNA (cytidine1409-2'-O)-methyltransferase
MLAHAASAARRLRVPNQAFWRARDAFRAPMPDNDAVTRLDQLLCERGLAETRSRAQALVMAGRVRVDGRLVTKAGTAIPGSASLEVEQGPAYVSRGGDKLATALAAFAIDVSGLACLDVGASTGGFTDCLLQAGAAHVTALDVGRGQLHERLRADDRVTLLEGVNARLLAPGDIPGAAAGLAVVDVSFISLALVLPPLVGVLARPYRLLPLVKPQFEAGRGETRRGVVRDTAVHAAVLERVAGAATEAGGVVLGACQSGHPGPAGNREFFLHIVSSDHPEAAGAPADPLPLLHDAVA